MQATPEQIAALNLYATKNGRTWRSKLLQDWQRAEYPSVDPDTGACLQQVRNTLGARWLFAYRPNKPTLE